MGCCGGQEEAGALAGAHVTLGIPGGCAWGGGTGLIDTSSSLHWVASPCSVGDILRMLHKWSSGSVAGSVEEPSTGELRMANAGLGQQCGIVLAWL